MVYFDMYKEIKKLQKRGNTKTDISQELSLDMKTVRKYWNMNEKKYLKYINKLKFRDKALEEFKHEIIKIYEANEFQPLCKSAVYDVLEETNGKLPAGERSLNNYINFLIETNELQLKSSSRSYQKVPELPYGQQLQIDFGEYKTRSGLKIYIFAAILSASRYRYANVQTRPFTTLDLIGHLLDCFEYIGGRPKQLVIDQDKTMVVSENYGDIIYTEGFSYFIHEMNLNLYVCRKADPETKGKIENLIKFIKGNFFSVRDFNNIEDVRVSLFSWLKRRANGKICVATHRIPQLMLVEEQKHLRELRASIYQKSSLLYQEKRIVYNHFVTVNAIHYSVPEEYKKTGTKVTIFKNDTNLYIFDLKGNEIAEHKLSNMKGKKISNINHFRTKKQTPKELKEKLLILYNLTEWQKFINFNYSKYTRYYRDQYREIQRHFGNSVDKKILKAALDLCLENKKYSVMDLKDSYGYFFGKSNLEDQIHKIVDIKPFLKNISQLKKEIKVNKRSLSTYKSMVNIITGVLAI